jgi:hypothetical protein
MVKAFLLLALISISLCSKPAQFLEFKDDDQGYILSVILKGIIGGVEIFDNIPCPEKCGITPQETLDLAHNVTLVLELIEVFFKPSVEYAVKLRTGLLGMSKLYLTLASKCGDAVPAFNERVHKVIVHMTSFEYIISLTYRIETNFDKWNDRWVDIQKHCDNDFTTCGGKMGRLIHDVILWDFE